MARPTSYKEEYNQKLIDHLASGMSYLTFAATIGISEELLYYWEKHYPPFLQAKKEGLVLNREFWEKKSIEALTDKIEYDENGKVIRKTSINPTVLIFNLKNRFPADWRDKREVVTDQTINQTTTINIDNQDLFLISSMLKEITGKKDDTIDVTPKALEESKPYDLTTSTTSTTSKKEDNGRP